MVSNPREPGDFSAADLGGAGASAGVRGAIDAAGPLLPLRDVEQLQLLPGDAVHQTEVHHAPRGRGRPAGASNKRTARVRDYMLNRYAHPLEFLGQVYSRPVDVLAAELGCEKVTALATQVKAAIEALPYLESKMPVQSAADGKPDVVLVMAAAGEGAATAERIREQGIDAIDWSSANVETAPAEMAEFREISDAREGKSE